MTVAVEDIVSPGGLTPSRRQEIIEDYARRHNGHWEAESFFDVVVQGEYPEARPWFEWNKAQGWRLHNIERARDFARGLKINFPIEVIKQGKTEVRTASVPFVHSPITTRKGGGGYIVTDPKNDGHMENLCAEAASSLAAWLRRYSDVLRYAGGAPTVIDRQVRALEAVAERDD